MAFEIDTWAVGAQIALSTTFGFLEFDSQTQWLRDRSQLDPDAAKVKWQMQWGFLGEVHEPGSNVRMVLGYAQMDFFHLTDQTEAVREGNIYSGFLLAPGKLHEVMEIAIDPQFWIDGTGMYDFPEEDDEPRVTVDPVRVGNHVQWSLEMNVQLEVP